MKNDYSLPTIAHRMRNLASSIFVKVDFPCGTLSVNVSPQLLA